MSRLRRKFSLEEKIHIIHGADQQGVELTLGKYQLSMSLYFKWKNSFDRQGTDVFNPQVPQSRFSGKKT